MKLAMTRFSIKHPIIVLGLVLALTIGLGLQMPKVHFDNDPENMLSAHEPVRLFHHEMKEKYSLYDFVIVGIVNNTHPDGVFNTETLTRLYDLTGKILRLHQGPDGKPAVAVPSENGEEEIISLDMAPESLWKKALGAAFQHNPNNLFNENGESVIISREIISPSVVDNIKQDKLHSLKIEYLMENPPHTREEALAIRDDAMNNPLYKGTLVSEDEKAIILYLPIEQKKYSYNVASLVRELTKDWGSEDQVYITGLPVAEDTFGVEMLIQMATSAPLAGLAIFLLMWLFFKRISLIIAPMLVALASIISTMGLLIGLGFDVHIMSSMIAIFLMPIAVADAVHILSEFFDVYPKFKDKKKTIEYVVGHLFMPMLYTTLTTIAGFASLGATPIPPVQIFGLHVAFGVGLAWVLTMTLIPAYIMLFVPEKSLQSLAEKHESAEIKGGLNRFLESLGAFSYKHSKMILGFMVLILAVSGYGINKINVNDNPVKWFTKDHPIRVADKVLNEHFGGTYTAYLTMSPAENGSQKAPVEAIREKAKDYFKDQEISSFLAAMEQLRVLNADDFFTQLQTVAIEQDAGDIWPKMADEINYMDPEGLTIASLQAALSKMEGTDAALKTLITELPANLAGQDLQDKALEVCDGKAMPSYEEFALKMQTELTAPLFKRPEMLAWLKSLQDYLAGLPTVGKTSSAVDALEKASYELQYQPLPAAADPDKVALIKQQNDENFSIPTTAAANGQVFNQLEGMKKKDSLFHLITRDYQEANLWVQLKSGDNQDMEAVDGDVQRFLNQNPPPFAIKSGWAGLTYINVIWQEKMVKGMLNSLVGSFIIVLIMMMVLFRSPIYGVLAMIPLSTTIAFIYGLIGLVGKDYDMPAAVLSALTLGLSVDFSIHFLQRAREMQKNHGTWKKAIIQMFKEPAMAISRNAITISVGFTPLLLAPLVPYKTVGFFLAAIMAISWMATLFILAALVTMLQKFLFKNNQLEEASK